MSSNLEFDMRPDTFGRVAVKKLSTQRTSSPRASSRSHRWEPMNPAPPVTRTRRLLNICLPHHSQELYNVLASARPSNSTRHLYQESSGAQMLNRNEMLESAKMGAARALSIGNYRFDVTVKVRQNASEHEFRSVIQPSQ